MEKEILTEKLRQSLGAIKSLKRELEHLRSEQGPVAVIGMGCKFPGNVDSPEDFWQLLISKQDGIVDIPGQRWNMDDFYSADKSVAGKITVRKGGFINEVDQFDAAFFGISPLEAEALDPQQRILLQTTWKAIESAGIPADNLKGSKTGVFIGISSPDYVYQRAGTERYDLVDIYDVTGNTPSTAAGRISYIFDLKGPCMAIDTACSSSLVTIHLACKSLQSNESDVVIAGGVNVILRPNAHVIFSKMGALSPEGRCKTFDADADGFVRSEGCGIVMLKRLKDAERDGDTILGVIKGTAINQDGRSNGFIAPNGLAQQEVLKKALANANLDPHDVSYIETHGTGTPLGDPIEIEAISHVYGQNRANDNTLYLGSVKTNLGHLESASGVASFIKAVLSLNRRCIPAHLNFNTPSPHIAWKDYLKVPTEAFSFKPDEKTLVAGVSAFGFSGTNAHILIAEYRSADPAPVNTQGTPVVLLSAKSDNALKDLAEKYAAYLKKDTAADLLRFSYTTATGRSHFQKRLAILPLSAGDCEEQLYRFLENDKTASALIRILPEQDLPVIAFLFTGQGSQYASMGRSLYLHEPVFKKAVDECLVLLDDRDSFEKMLFDGRSDQDIHQTRFAQPAIFIIQYGLIRLWQSLGIKPSVLLGHSIGEVAAACLAQVFSLQDALKLIVARGRLMQELCVPGKMVSVSDAYENVHTVISRFSDISMAAINNARSVVISGRTETVDQAIQVFHKQGVHVRELKTSHAFHSGLMTPMLSEFRKVCHTIVYNFPKIPVVSTVTGRKINAEIAAAEYWVNQVVSPVLFSEGLKTLRLSGANIFMEIGARPVLSGLISLDSEFKKTVITGALSENLDDRVSIATGAANLYTNGVSVAWNNFFGNRIARLSIPSYPFQTKRYWLEPMEVPKVHQKGKHPFLGPRTKIASEKETYVWQSRFSISGLPFLEDHQIEHAIVFPAACYTETAIAAIIELTSRQQVELYDIAFEKIFILQKAETYELQIRVTKAEQVYRFNIHTRVVDPAKETPWVFRISGAAVVKDSVPERLQEMEQVKSRLTKHITGEEFYNTLFEAGNHWNTSFRGVEHIWSSETEILSLSKIPSVIKHQVKDFHSHPALMDICGQLMAADAGRNHTGAFVGKSIGKLTVYGKLEGDAFWSYARVSKLDDQGSITGDISVYNTSGELLASTSGLVFSFINETSAEATMDHWIHTVSRELCTTPPPQAAGEKKWLMMDPGSELYDALYSLKFPVKKLHDISGLPAALDKNQRIVYVVPDTLDSVHALALAMQDIAKILKYLAAHPAEDIKVWIIIRQAPGSGSPESVMQSTFRGLAKSIEVENVNHWGGILELQYKKIAEPELRTVCTWINADAGENDIILDEHGIYVPRIARTKARSSHSPEFRQDSAYLITGGLGDLGLLTAQWMVSRGARRLILTSRYGMPSRSRWKALDPATPEGVRINKIKALERAGALVEIATVDISDQAAFRSWYDSYVAKDFPVIKGVVHAAGNVTPCLFGEETTEQVVQQLEPKIQGALSLHNVLGEGLDFFVLFSSASSVLHSPKLAVYAAANSFMDALALLRRKAGKPALSINWAAWKETGIVAKNMDAQQSNYQIMGLIAPLQGLQILEDIWHSQQAQIAVLPISWDRWKSLLPTIADRPYYKEVVTGKSTGVSGELALMPVLENGHDEETKLLHLEAYLGNKIAQLLRLDKNEIDSSTSLAEYGLDSMVAIELKNRIESELKVSLQIIDLIHGPSIQQLAVTISKYHHRKAVDDVLKPVRQAVRTNVPIELSTGQQSLWTLHKMDPLSPAYHIAFTARIVNGLDIDKWQQAFETVLKRHEILKARFQEIDGVVSQLIPADEDYQPPKVMVTDVRGLSDEMLQKKLREMYEEPFNLSGESAVRCALLYQGDNAYVLLLTIHHLVSDGWSLWIILDEIKIIYADLVDGRGLSLPENQFTYVDFIAWQKQNLSGAAGAAMLNFWKTKLGGELPVLNLPVDSPRTHNISGKTIRFDIDPVLADKLRKFAQQESLTLYTAALGLFKILLYRYSATEDIIVGSPTSGRGSAAFAEVVGDFINLVAIRTQPAAHLSMRAYLREVRKAVLEVLVNQDFPFPLLVKELNPVREIGRTPVFQALFSLQKPQKFDEIITLLEGHQADWGKLTLQPYPMPQQEGQFDITLELIENSNGIAGVVKYNDQIFKHSTITRMYGHYTNLISCLVDNPDQLLGQVSLTPEKETQDILSRWHGPAVVLPGKCIHEIIDERSVSDPGRVALVSGDDQLTYAELILKANRFAAYLVEKRGVMKGASVGICARRSFEMVVTMLAVLKTGAAYVPLDPNFPAERLKFIASDSGVGHIVSTTENFQLFPDYRGAFIDLDKELSMAHRHDPSCFPAVDQSDTAYVIYTSGSSGKPKATLISHANLMNFCMGMDLAIGTQPGTMLATTTISFDIAVLELLWTLTNGFKVVIQDDNAASFTTHSSANGAPGKVMDFSLFYFSSADEEAEDKYRLLIDGAKYADANGFKAIWTPERHFHEFGGLFPNPSLTSAALATITSSIELRAGSVVAPLHHPVRIAEEWSVVDNLSHGRIGVAFASGWQANDFVLARATFEQRYEHYRQNIDIVRKLWAGEEVKIANAGGEHIACRLFPKPVQSTLPVWITTAGNVDTFMLAGKMGFNILTHLLTQSVAELKDKIAAYKEARGQNGHDPEGGRITIMMHTFIGSTMQEVRDVVYKPFTGYLRSSFDLMKNMARTYGIDVDASDFATKGIDAIMPKAFERYFNTASLMGTVEHCRKMVDELYRTGITEIGCLIDFGVPYAHSMHSLKKIKELKDLYRGTNARKVYSVAENVRHNKVTHIQSTPSMMRMLLSDEATTQELKHIKKIFLGGEKVPASLVREIEKISGAEIYNMYGPTETTVWSSVGKIERGQAVISIGEPVVNTSFYILDQFLKPVQEGVTGELYIGGKGVSAGYRNQPALTSGKFIQNPFAHKNDPVLYRTGDLVRYDAAYRIEYLERADLQVKINGHRVEVEEVESVLSGMDPVRECAVIFTDGSLTAYVVAKENLTVDPEQVRPVLRAALPAYMIPKFIKVIEGMPLTPNGKTDRKKLAGLQEHKPDKTNIRFAAAESDIEKRLVAIWQQLLAVKTIGIDDNFFELGGDSILSVQLTSKAKEQGLQFTVNQLFQNQTIRELALVVKNVNGPGPEQNDITGFHTLTPIQHWFFDLKLNNLSHYNQALMLRLPQTVNPEHLALALDAIKRHHDVLRSGFLSVDGIWQQVYNLNDHAAVFEHVNIAGVEAHNRETFISAHAAKTQASLDIHTGNVFKAVLYWSGDDNRPMLLMVAHHLVMDGYSWRIIFNDLHTILQQLADGKTVRLPSKTTSYKAWANKLKENCAAPFLHQHLSYWNDYPVKAPGVIPVKSQPGMNTVESTAKVVVHLNTSDSHDILEKVPKVFAIKINELLLTALYMTLSKWTNDPDIFIDVEGHGRENIWDDMDVSRTAGWFTTITPLRLYAAAGDNAGALLREIKETVRAIPVHANGYGMLRYLSEHAAAAPLKEIGPAPVLFNYLGQFQAPADGWEHVDSDIGCLYDPTGNRSHPLEIIGMYSGNRFSFTWNYSKNLHGMADIKNLADDFVNNLLAMKDHCLSSGENVFTPSDFPQARINNKDLEKLMSKFK